MGFSASGNGCCLRHRTQVCIAASPRLVHPPPRSHHTLVGRTSCDLVHQHNKFKFSLKSVEGRSASSLHTEVTHGRRRSTPFIPKVMENSQSGVERVKATSKCKMRLLTVEASIAKETTHILGLKELYRPNTGQCEAATAELLPRDIGDTLVTTDGPNSSRLS
jgi:hypothetical protein